MKDETYSFISDVKEKGTVARSSHNRRSHTWRVIEEGGDDDEV